MELVRVLSVLRYELGFLVGGLALIISYRLLAGTINVNGLLNSKTPPYGYSPARLQLLLFTLGGAIFYAYQCYEQKCFVPVPAQLDCTAGWQQRIVCRR